jgi:hypothetical protein
MLDYEKMWNELQHRLENMLGYVGYSSKANKRTQGIQQALSMMEEIKQEESNNGIQSERTSGNFE